MSKYIKRVAVIVAMAVAILFITGCIATRDISVRDAESSISFRDIPGITEGEIAAIEALQSSRQSFTFGNMYSTEVFLSDDGEFVGFTPLFCALLTNMFEIPFEFEILEWDDLYDGFIDMSIDFTGELTPTAARREIFYMSSSIAERSFIVMIEAGNESIKAAPDLNGLKIGFLAGTITDQSIRTMYGDFDFEVVDIGTMQEAAEKLMSAEIDAFITDSIDVIAFAEYDSIIGLDILRLVYAPVSLSTANPELEPIISAFNKYLEAGGVYVTKNLYSIGKQIYAAFELARLFTDEEKAYIAAFTARDEKIPIVLEHDNYPISFFNDAEDEFQGVAPDVLAEISFLTGLEFEIINDKDSLWIEILEMIQSGEAALISDLRQTYERRGNFLWLDEPYYVSHYVFLSKSELPHLEFFQVPHAITGVSRGTVYEEMYRTWFPGSENLVLFDSLSLALDGLENGEVDILLTANYSLLYQINFRESPGYKINLTVDSLTEGSYFGLNAERETLRSILNKTQSFVDTRGIARNWTDRIYDYSIVLAQQRAAYLTTFVTVLGALLIALIVLLIRNSRMRAQVEVALVSATAASKAKGDFLSNISHEIRTPMSAIIGMTHIGKSSNDYERKDYSLGRIEVASKHLLGIINDVLDISKIEAGKFELSSTDFDFGKMLDSVVNVIMFRADDKKQTLTVNIADDIPKILVGDDQRLAQAITNFAGNAIKFTPEFGKIDISAVLVGAENDVYTIQMKITDTGVGIESDQLKKLFDSFHQVDNSLSRDFEGTGLGLAITKKIVEKMGGEIFVESELGKGSTFTFTVELRSSTVSESELADRQQIKLLRREITELLMGRNVLVAEDVDVNREIVQALLEPTMINIDFAENGAQAVEMFSEMPEKYDIIFMDVQMPKMDGYEATRTIRALDKPRASDIPIIAMTANVFREDIERCIEAGMNSHIGKPVNNEELMAHLQKYINGVPYIEGVSDDRRKSSDRRRMRDRRRG